MPHSLRARLSGLRYKKIISDKDYDRLRKALDNEDALDKIRKEVNEIRHVNLINFIDPVAVVCAVIEIIDKYREEQE